MAKKKSKSGGKRVRNPTVYHTGRFPPRTVGWDRLIPLLGPAHGALRQFYGRLDELPNPRLLLAPLSKQEAVLSSRIEGTQANLTDVLDFEAGMAPGEDNAALRDDVEEILNYRKALERGVDRLKKLPICGRLLDELHGILLAGVRGADKGRGRIRTIQNYIGRMGTGIGQARFIPIDPSDLTPGLSRWEKYVNGDQPDRLVQLAFMHAEFESLHPYLDGNGRLGRILVPLFLVHHGLLNTPSFYISEYLEERRDEYCDRLLAVSRDDDWTGWAEFFLKAVTVQSKRNEARVVQVRDLYEEHKRIMTEQVHSQYAVPVLDFIFQQVTFNTTQFVQQTGIPTATARRNLAKLEEIGVLQIRRPAAGQRPSIYSFPRLQRAVELVAHA